MCAGLHLHDAAGEGAAGVGAAAAPAALPPSTVAQLQRNGESTSQSTSAPPGPLGLLWLGAGPQGGLQLLNHTGDQIQRRN